MIPSYLAYDAGWQKRTGFFPQPLNKEALSPVIPPEEIPSANITPPAKRGRPKAKTNHAS